MNKEDEEEHDLKLPENGYFNDIFDVLDAMLRDRPYCVAVDGCGSSAELCDCQILLFCSVQVLSKPNGNDQVS